MSAKKTMTNAVDVAELYETIDELKAKNAALYEDCCDLQKQNELLVKESIEAENNYGDERKRRVKAEKVVIDMQNEIKRLAVQIEAAKTMRAVEKRKRHGSIPKFIIVSAISLVVLLASFMLQKLSAIGPSVGYTIQCGMSMIIAWCYAIIWDRSRK